MSGADDMMKMIIAIVSDEDSIMLMDNFSKEGIGATKLCSSGGFLKAGNTTVLIGTEEENVDSVLESIKKSCQSHSKLISPSQVPGYNGGFSLSMPIEIKVGGATVFVLDVEQFIKY